MKIYDDTKKFFILKNLIIHVQPKFIFAPEYLEYIFACIDLYDQNEAVNQIINFRSIATSFSVIKLLTLTFLLKENICY